MASPEAHLQAKANPGRLDNPALEFLRTYWLRKRGARAMPARKDMVPSEMRKYIDGMVMIDVLPGADEFRYRLVGTAVVQYCLTDATGKTVSEAWAPLGKTAIDRIRANLRAVVRERACIYLSGVVNWSGHSDEPFEALYVPLSDDGVTVNRIINLFTFDRRRILLDRQIAAERGRKTLTA